MKEEELYTTLDKNPDLFDQLTNLIPKCFNYPKDQSFKVDFFPLMEKENWSNLHLITDKNNEILAHIGLKILSINNQVQISLLG